MSSSNTYKTVVVDFTEKNPLEPNLYVQSGETSNYKTSKVSFNKGELDFKLERKDGNFSVVGYSILNATNNEDFGVPSINLDFSTGSEAKFGVRLSVGGFIKEVMQDLAVHVHVAEPIP